MRWVMLLAPLFFAPPPVPEASADAKRRESIERMNAAIDAYAKHQLDEAERGLLEAVKLDSGYPEPQLNLGRFYYASQRYDDAERSFTAALGQAAETAAPQIHYELGVTLITKSSVEGVGTKQARTLLERSIESFDQTLVADPADDRAQWRRASALDRLDRPRAADQGYRKCIEHRPQNTACFTGLGFLYLDYGFDTAALAVLDLSTQVNGLDVEAWMAKAHGSARLDRMADAIAEAKKAAALDPDWADAYFVRGMAHAELRQRAEAVEALQAFLAKAAPDAPEAQQQAARQTLASLGELL